MSGKGWPWKLGQTVQGIALGLLLFRALMGVMAFAENIVAFRYQGF